MATVSVNGIAFGSVLAFVVLEWAVFLRVWLR